MTTGEQLRNMKSNLIRAERTCLICSGIYFLLLIYGLLYDRPGDAASYAALFAGCLLS